jgi:hypothetical protein
MQVADVALLSSLQHTVWISGSRKVLFITQNVTESVVYNTKCHGKCCL